jgi:hypothetical protein
MKCVRYEVPYSTQMSGISVIYPTGLDKKYLVLDQLISQQTTNKYIFKAVVVLIVFRLSVIEEKCNHFISQNWGWLTNKTHEDDFIMCN